MEKIREQTNWQQEMKRFLNLVGINATPAKNGVVYMAAKKDGIYSTTLQKLNIHVYPAYNHYAERPDSVSSARIKFDSCGLRCWLEIHKRLRFKEFVVEMGDGEEITFDASCLSREDEGILSGLLRNINSKIKESGQNDFSKWKEQPEKEMREKELEKARENTLKAKMKERIAQSVYKQN